MTATDQTELRALVQELLREVLPAVISQTASRVAETRTGAVTPAPDIRPVRLTDDADLAHFVQEVLALTGSPASLAALKAGTIRFTLQAQSRAAAPSSGHHNGPVPTVASQQRHDKGPVTEAHVKQAARNGADLVLGPRAVLTPLARDSARTLGVTTIREERKESR